MDQFNYPSNVSELDEVSSHIKKRSNKDTDSNQQVLNYINRNIFGKVNWMEKLIVINVIVTSLLTVARKFGCSCVYIFQITYWEKLNWRIILLQTKTFNIFPRSIEKSGVLKIVSANCSRNTVSYILNKELWFNIPFLNLLNKKSKTWQTIDWRQNKQNDPGKFKSNADNEKNQVC